MTASSRKLLAIKRAKDNYGRVRDVLAAELDRGAPRACLEGLVELGGLYIEQTGGTLETLALRRELGALLLRVEARPHLREVKTMQLDIEIADICPQCSAPGRLSLEGSAFCCVCSGCYDGTEDAHLGSQVVGRGNTARAAVADWLEKSEEHVPQHVGYWPTELSLLVAAEARRQAGWVETETPQGIWYAPELIEAAE